MSQGFAHDYIIAATGQTAVFVNGTAVTAATGSPTEIDFTIPSGVKKFTVSFVGVSTSGTSGPRFQIGDAGGIETSGYLGGSVNIASSAQSGSTYTNGLGMSHLSGSAVLHGLCTWVLVDAATNTWAANGNWNRSDTAYGFISAASKSLSSELTTLRVTTSGGSETFDAGEINIQYENQDHTLGLLTPVGGVVQVVNTQDGEHASNTTALPHDDSIPQITEGEEIMTASITPTDSANILRIDVVVCCSASAANHPVASLFQDSTANALAAASTRQESDGLQTMNNIAFSHYMTAGTASSTTFRVRGGAASGTFGFNGSAAARRLGGVMASSITITEYKV